MATKTKKKVAKKKFTVTDHMRLEALDRAETGTSERNYAAIFDGFSAKGINDIEPRENIFTYNAWIAKGRQVKKGEKGVAIESFITMVKDDPKNSKEKLTFRRPKTTYVFHISQTLDIKTGAEYLAETDDDEGKEE